MKHDIKTGKSLQFLCSFFEAFDSLDNFVTNEVSLALSH